MAQVSRSDLKEWVLEALQSLNRASIPAVAKHIWEKHEAELRASGDLFYTWQYAMRWEAQKLQHEGKILKLGKSGLWELR
ncbi:MAG: hypothetical protein EBR34_09705 [Sphingomonadaceae bacterium]|nr:hypothetical protein [Sphingomonadaceae bacterium]